MQLFTPRECAAVKSELRHRESRLRCLAYWRIARCTPLRMPELHRPHNRTIGRALVSFPHRPRRPALVENDHLSPECSSDGDGVLSRHDIKWLYDAVYKDETTCVSLEDLTCQIFDMAGTDGSAHDDALRGGITCAAVRGSRLADGIFGILCNHDDMLLRRSTAEFSNEHAVPM